MTYEIEIGRGKRGRRAYSLDDIAIVPNRRTRDPKDVSVSWQIDAYQFDMPVIAAPMDSAMSPATAIALGRLGGLGVLDLEGLWTRYEDPQAVLDQIAALDDETLRRLRRVAEDELRLDALVEVHTKDELRRAAAAGATLVGVNNRDLNTFKVSLDVSVELAREAAPGTTLVAESGLRFGDDLRRLKALGYCGFLVGESLMRAERPGRALRDLIGGGA